MWAEVGRERGCKPCALALYYTTEVSILGQMNFRLGPPRAKLGAERLRRTWPERREVPVVDGTAALTLLGAASTPACRWLKGLKKPSAVLPLWKRARAPKTQRSFSTPDDPSCLPLDPLQQWARSSNKRVLLGLLL